MNNIITSGIQGNYRALNFRRASLVALACVSIFAGRAHAAGYEKGILWDGHYGAIAGAAQSSVMGPQALYWNPAALGGSQGLQINGDFSPTWVQFSGPAALSTNAGATGTTQYSNTGFLPIGAAFVGYGITPQWGVAIGYYVSGGNEADYGAVPLNSTLTSAPNSLTYQPPLKADLRLTEFSAGTGFEILPGLKLGAAYRLLFVKATLDTAGSTALGGPFSGVVSTQINNISVSNSGFRVGLEYAPKDSPWGFGVTYRNQVRFVANGSANVTLAGPTGAGLTPGGAPAGTGENVLVSSTFPQVVNAAVHYHITPTLTGFLGYSFLNYSTDQALGISGVSVNGTLQQSQSTDVPLGWTNEHDIKVAADYTGFVNWPVRAGFLWASQVSSNADALPILPAPGPGYSVFVGTGHEIIPNLTVDGAFEYSWDGGSVSSANNPAGTTAIGSYSANATAVHLSGTYTF